MIQIFNYDGWSFQKFKWTILIKNKKEKTILSAFKTINYILFKTKNCVLRYGWKLKIKWWKII